MNNKTPPATPTDVSSSSDVAAVQMLRWQLACTMAFAIAAFIAAIFVYIAVSQLSSTVANCCTPAANGTEPAGELEPMMHMVESFRKRQQPAGGL